MGHFPPLGQNPPFVSRYLSTNQNNKELHNLFLIFLQIHRQSQVQVVSPVVAEGANLLSLILKYICILITNNIYYCMNIYLSLWTRRDGATLRDASVKVGHRRGVSGKSFGGSVPQRPASHRYLSIYQPIKTIKNPTIYF